MLIKAEAETDSMRSVLIELQVDWNPVNNLIISGGEDCKYKVADSARESPLRSVVLDFVRCSSYQSADC